MGETGSVQAPPSPVAEVTENGYFSPEHGHTHPPPPLCPCRLQHLRSPQPKDQPVQVVRLHAAGLRGEGVLQQLQPQLLLRGPLRDLRGHMVSSNSLLKGGRGGKKGVGQPQLKGMNISAPRT